MFELQQKQMKTTKEVLNEISKHLSNRAYLRNKNYKVFIFESEKQSFIQLYVHANVFPSSHQRKESDKVHVIWDVVVNHFSHIYDADSNDTNLTLGKIATKRGVLVSGLYEYKSSLYNKRRKWFSV